MRITLLAVGAALTIAAPALAGPTFILNDIGGVGAGTQARAGFTAAAALWSSVFSNNVTLDLNVGFQALSSGVLGQTGSASTDVSYANVRSALVKNAATADDRSAVASLAPTLSFITNTLSGGVTNALTHVLENNQASRDTQYLSVNTANQKALGLMPARSAAVDAVITFSSAFKWTFDASQGVAKSTYDFVGIAAHEIGHALGFVSGVDTADAYAQASVSGLDSTAWGTPLDLFRYDTAGGRDWTVGGTPCLSVDGGENCGAGFATGYSKGDHYQASHWKHGYHLGIMDPAIALGQLLSIGPNDLQAFDAIGWNLAAPRANTSRVTWGPVHETPNPESPSNIVTTAVPEPGAITLFGLGIIASAIARRRAK